MKTNKTRKFLCVLLSMLLVVAMIPATAFGETTPLDTIEINLTKQPSFGTSRTYTNELAGDILSSFSIDEDAPYEITQRSIGTGMWRTDRVWDGETIDLEKEYWVYLLVESKFVGSERPDIFTNNVAVSFDGVTPITSDVEQSFNFRVEVYVKIDTSQIPTTQPQIDPITVELEDAPTFTAGMTLDEINAYSPEDYANAEADGVEDVTYTWMVKVDESFKVDGATWFNTMIDVVMNNYGGWMALDDDYLYYRDLVGNEEFGIKIDFTREDGRYFEKNRNRYKGTVNDGDAEVDFDYVTPGMDALSLYYSVGTVEAGPTYKITLDKSEYDHDGLEVYAYDGTGAFDPDMLNQNDSFAFANDNGDVINLPEEGYMVAVCEDRFKISAEGATISTLKKLYIEEWDIEFWYYELTNFTKDTVVKVTPLPDVIVDTVDIQVDWEKVPQLEKGMKLDDIPLFEVDPAVVTATGIDKNKLEFGWAIRLDDDCKITEEDPYYNDLVNSDEYGLEFIEDFNKEIDESAYYNNGWASIDLMFVNPYYEINEDDTYSLYVAMYTEEGYRLGNFVDGGYYPGEITSNVSDYSTLARRFEYYDGMAVFLKLGTLEEIEDSKNGETTPTTPTTPDAPSTEAPKTETPKTETPATGDANSVLPMAAVMVAAGAAVVVANKKREEEK